MGFVFGFFIYLFVEILKLSYLVYLIVERIGKKFLDVLEMLNENLRNIVFMEFYIFLLVDKIFFFVIYFLFIILCSR